MAKDSFSPLDAEKVLFCQSCPMPVKACDPYSVRCPFNQKYGMRSDPKTFLQSTCGVQERGEDFGDIADKIKYSFARENAEGRA